MPAFRHLILAILACAACSAGAAAAPLVVKAERYFDASTGALVTPAVIVVEDGVIAAVNPRELPAGAETLDLSGLTLLPGLIDAHTHLTQDATNPGQLHWPEHGPTDFALQGVSAARRTLEAGFTTARDLGAAAFSDVALMRAVERGWIAGPDVIPAGHGIGISGGHCDGVPAADHDNASPKHGVADGAAEVIEAVRLQVKNGARVIKVCVTAGVMSAGNTLDAVQMTDEELAAAVAEAHRQGRRIAAHAHGNAGILAAARAGVDSIEHASFLSPEALRLIKEKNVTLVPTLYLLSAFDLKRLPERLHAQAIELRQRAEAGFRSAVEARVNIVFGSDAAVIPHGDNAREFAARVALGQSPRDALLSATSRAADLLGLRDRGLIAAGRRADLIAVEGDPLADIRTLERVRFVMKQGRVFKRSPEHSAPYDLVISRGRVMDPQSGFDAIADVAIKGDRIVAVSTEPLRGRREIDATGLVVAPGFIDLHAHDHNPQTHRLHALDGVTTALELEAGVYPIADWYRQHEGKAPINFGASVSHGMARALAFGAIEPRDLAKSADALLTKLDRHRRWAEQPASPAQLGRIKALMTEGAQAGGLGFGYHLADTPGASPEEMLELYALSAQLGLPNFIHIRSIGQVSPLEAGREIIAAARTTGASIHVVHINSSGLWETRPLLDALYEAQRSGLDITTEVYPYTGAHSFVGDPRVSSDTMKAFQLDYSALELIETGERLTEARYRELTQSKPRADLIAHVMKQDDIDHAVAHPMVMIASDGVAFHGDLGHPRGAGTFARILGHYAREKGSLTLMQALAKMTLMPARRLEAIAPQMRERGRLQPGMIADITVFDPARVADRAAYGKPVEPSAGIVHVLVSGTAVVERSVFREGQYPGRAIRRSSQPAAGVKSAAPAVAAAAPLQAQLQQIMESAVASAKYPGAIMRIEAGDETWSLASGVGNVDAGAPIRPGDRFRCGSILKPFLAAVVLQLVEEGRLRLDDSLPALLPQQYWGRFQHAESITLRMLMSHRSGLGNWTDVDLYPMVMPDPGRIWSAEELLDIAAGLAPTFEPGRSYAYSNTGYNLVGLIVEQVTGLSWRENIRRRILAPLASSDGLSDTFLPEPGDRKIPGEHARGYVAWQEKEVDLTEMDPSMAGAAGGHALVSSTRDLSTFLKALLAGRFFRQPDTLATMLDFLPTNLPGPRQGYGLGIGKYVFPDNLVAYGHTGGTAGYASIVIHLPGEDITASAMINGDESAPIASFAIGDFLLPSLDLVRRHRREVAAATAGQLQ